MGAIQPRTMPAERNWHAIFTRHQFERSVAASLSSKGHEIYLPLCHSLRRWQDRTKHLWLPLFPGYVFICEGLDRQFQIITTPGVISVVGCAGRPAIVPQDELDAIRQVIESRVPVVSHPFLQRGDRVRVKSGPLMGLEGILTRKKGVDRLVVSIEMLGRSAAVEIDSRNVERIGPFAIPMLPKRVSAFA